ncbi:MAG TPA: hypothetical protein QGF58_07870 [Myxococcota bacterium]|nr:hypothetical protein [Myxococcota bacterium]
MSWMILAACTPEPGDSGVNDDPCADYDWIYDADLWEDSPRENTEVEAIALCLSEPGSVAADPTTYDRVATDFEGIEAAFVWDEYDSKFSGLHTWTGSDLWMWNAGRTVEADLVAVVESEPFQCLAQRFRGTPEIWTPFLEVSYGPLFDSELVLEEWQHILGDTFSR